ncbi:leukocyte surface antigen CD47 isoform X3 [Ascaphus truei]|uniref:leukocyte surface antigen CD47 isoform X3 n=1 Tax=Ascaphus truei TaxID=8439 RepID=UPI003F599E3F
MLPLTLLVLGSFSCGLAQLQLQKQDPIKFNGCEEQIVVPCFVLNLKENDVGQIFVQWKYNDASIYTFDGPSNTATQPAQGFSSVKVILSNLPSGNASLWIARSEVASGNYTCVFTVGNSEGRSDVELLFNKTKCLRYTARTQYVFIITGLFISAFVIAGCALFFHDDLILKTVELYLLVLPFVFMVPFIFYLLKRIPIMNFLKIGSTLLFSLGCVIKVIGLIVWNYDCIRKYEFLIIIGISICTATLLSNVIIELIRYKVYKKMAEGSDLITRFERHRIGVACSEGSYQKSCEKG